jgi:tRNA/rRNA methyltransferase
MPLISIILVRPQMGENIGLSARAMGNFGITDLRLVAPRDPWPNLLAQSASVGARSIIDKAALFGSLEEATNDLQWIFCTTARQRYIKKEFYSLKEGCNFIKTNAFEKIGIVFGPEQAGLTNEEVSICHGALSIPTHTAVSSLNLAHAVLLCVYEFSQIPPLTSPSSSSAASQGRILSFLAFLEECLEEKGFFFPREKMQQNLRDIFLRRPLSSDDINTLFGAVKALQRTGDKSCF